MGTAYRKDKDLEFLRYCEEADLRSLGYILIYDKDGMERHASKILSDKKFIAHKGKADLWRRSWELIAGDLQHFGGDSIVNLFRQNGVLYQEILLDVCDKMKVETDKKASAYENENRLIEKLAEQAWKKISENEREAIIEELKAKNAYSKGATALASIQAGGLASYIWSRLLAGSVVNAALPRMAVSGVATVVAGRAVSLVNPILAIAVTVPLISGAAYRVTLPAVLQIAFMRRQYEQKERF